VVTSITGQRFHTIRRIANDIINRQEYYNKRNGNIVFNCELIRSYLKKLRLTQYNPNISYIREYIERNLNISCNESYYELSSEEINHIIALFNSIQNKYEELRRHPEVLSRIKKKSIHNNLYYSFYLETNIESNHCR